MSKLTIYKASAGSGKTFRLTREYLKILFLNRYNYRNILAVTFTNKAANEMKTRILKEVNIIAKGAASDHIEEIIKLTNKTKEQTISDAKQIQNLLLHDYSFFSVKTIDSFFQDIIKSFTKEIGLQLGFQLELDSDEVLDKAIEKVILSIEKDNETRKWFLSFAKDKISDGKRWDFKKDLVDFSREIFKEKFTTNKAKLAEKLEDRKFLTKFKSELIKQKKLIEERASEIGNSAIDLMKEHNLELSDFSYGKSGFFNYFYKFSEGVFVEAGNRVIEAQEDVEKWYSKKSTKKDEITSFYNSGANGLLNQAIELFESNIEQYNSLKIVSSLINVFGIIADISKAVGDVSDEENIFLISYSAPFINAIISDNETPFIYEKIGARYKYFMIDEFQDTSSIQWNNFKPLISDNLAQGNNSLIVGDVKQSIYRWRNSDWKLLSEGIYSDFHPDYIKNITLDSNYRSTKEIIQFNNKVFTEAAKILQNEFNNNLTDEHKNELNDLTNKVLNAYKDNEQKIPENNKRKGYIRFEKVPKDKDVDQKELVLSRIPNILMEIQDKGYKMKDVAFLVRSKAEGALLVDSLMQFKNENPESEKYNFNLISNEALFIGNSPAIKLLIALIRDLSSKQELINRVFIKYEYEIYLKESNLNLHSIFSDKNLFIDEYDKRKKSLATLSFYEIIEKLTDIFKLNLSENNFIYLQAFNDLIKDFSSNKNLSIIEFIEWWDEKGSLSPISLNENQDAAQILTIHKSKGLEFKIVIVPFADWDLNKSGDIIWTESDVAPFNDLDILPVKYSKDLKKSTFYKEYHNEILQQYVDNLNLLYVTFTRAENMLFIFSKEKSKKKDDGLKTISEVLFSILKEDIEDNIYEYGEIIENDIDDIEPDVYKLNSYLANSVPKSLNIKMQSKNFFSVDKNEKINRGLLYHKIFENIINYSDIENAVRLLVNEGSISVNDETNFIKEIKDLISELKIEHWFDGTYRVKNEMSILYNNEVKRPDRLMFSDNEVIIVDYKFGDKEQLSYKKQLNGYKKTIELMGFNNIKAYIWYVNKKTITEVK